MKTNFSELPEKLKIMWNKRIIVKNEIGKALEPYNGFLSYRPTPLFETKHPVVIDEKMQRQIDNGILWGSQFTTYDNQITSIVCMSHGNFVFLTQDKAKNGCPVCFKSSIKNRNPINFC